MTDISKNNNNEKDNIFLKRGSYRQEFNIENKQKYLNSVNSNNNNNNNNNKNEKENNIKTLEMRQNHKDDLNNFYLKYKDEIETRLKVNNKKIAVAMMFGYDGTDFYGLGYQVDIKYPTIENLIEKVLFRLGHILPTNVGEIKRLKWSHSSRTDKGVHSLSTVISCFLVINDNHHDNHDHADDYLNNEFINNVNQLLPNSVRLFSATKVNRSFNARKQGIERSYGYLVPQNYLKDISINRMNEILSNFIGINSFHNYTSKRSTYIINNNKKHNDDDDESSSNEEESDEETEETKTKVNSNNRILEKELFRNNSINVRNIKSFYVENDCLEILGCKWYRFIIVGESFILYQIRKMMGFFLAVANNLVSEEHLILSIKSPFSINVPVSPPFPLYLFNVKFMDSINPSEISTLFNNSSLLKIQSLQDQFLQNKLIPIFNEIENQTCQFKQFFENLINKHNYNLDDIDNLRILYKEYQIEKEEKKKQNLQILKEKQEKDQLILNERLKNKELKLLKKKELYLLKKGIINHEQQQQQDNNKES